MSAETAEMRPAPDDLVALADRNGYELIDGELVEKSMGMEAGVVAVNILTLLRTHVKARNLGHVIEGECGYQIFPEEPKRVRKPDGSFIARGRLPDDRPVRG